MASGAPFWPALVALAPTLAHDAAVLGESGAPPTGRLAGIWQEVLLLTRSTPDPHLPALGVDFFDAAARAVAAALPRATRRVVDASGHALDAAAVAPVVAGFLGATA
ncbi:hypothetical protein RDV89_04735 [Nocardioides zeae]|uniref:Uncharacterized protein n=1 Tax=Nocardioides imazamoxiresistens TaxID=3231893 RepID=A0ABU3PSZ4_9ACTN|nr:hypothetical protein [Nocardioides zeae]MDT9592359.1 hypothetical protein [Nocardioides zeae]